MNTKTISLISGIFAFIFLSLVIVNAASVTLSSPANNTSTTTTAATFDYSSDITNITSCSLYLNTFLNSSTPNTNSFSLNLAPNTYLWSVNCTNSSTSAMSNTFTLIIASNPQISISQSGLSKTSSGTITVTNTGNTPLSNLALSSLNDADFSVIFGALSSTSLNPGQSATASISSTNANSLTVKNDNTLTIKITSDKATSTAIVAIQTSICANGEVGNLSISSFSPTDYGTGDDTDWNPLDNIKIDVDVTNNGGSSISSVIARIFVIDPDTGNDVTSKFDFTDTKISLGRITDGDTQTATFEITSLPSNIDEKSNYRVYIKAYKDGSESSTCTDIVDGNSFQEIGVSKQFDTAVIVKQTDLTNIQASCGDSINLPITVYNIGNQREDSVLVTIFNQDLNLSQSQIISSLGKNNNQAVDFNFVLPNNLAKTKYPIIITTYFDYKGSNRDPLDPISYNQNSFNDLDVSYYKNILVSNCQAASPFTVSASLTSDASVGKEMTVLATITNSGTATDFVVTPINYESWAQLVSVNPPASITIPQGTSKQVTFTFKPTKSGTQTFDIQTINNGKTSTQAVQVDVASNSGFLSAFNNLGGNTGMIIIAVVLIILILIVIILIVRVSSRKNKTSDF